MKIYASLNNDKSLEIFQDIAGGNIWVKVKNLDFKLTTYIKIYSVSINTEDIPHITYSSLPFWAHDYLDYEEDEGLYDDDYEVFQRLRTKQKTQPAHWFEVVTPVQMFTDDEIDEIISSYPIVHDG